MEPENRIPIPAFAGGMLIISVLLGPSLIGELRHWEALDWPLRIVDSTFLAAVVVLTASAALLFSWRRSARFALMCGAVAASVVGIGLILGTFVNLLPCGGFG